MKTNCKFHGINVFWYESVYAKSTQKRVKQ